MKGSLHFNLPEEEPEFILAQNASRYHTIVWDMYDYLKRQQSEDAKGIFEELQRLMERYRIDDT